MATNIANVSFPYISIKLKNINLTWRGNAPDYFTSLTYDRYVDKANTGTLTITYAPGPNDDPNAVELAIVQSKGDVLLQYGHANSHIHQQRCMISGYKVSISEGVFTYTLDLVSRAVIYNWAEAKVETFTGTNANRDFVLKYMEEEVKKIKVSDKQAYEFEVAPNAKDFEVSTIEDVGVGLSPFAALIQIARGLRCPNDDAGRYYYAIEVDDSTNTVYLRKIDTNQTAAEYTFNWGTKDSDVLSWSIDYEGSIAIARAKGISLDAKYTSGIDTSTGKMYSYKPGITDIDKPVTVDELDTIKSEEYNAGKFAELADHCYTATLTVIGQPRMLTIGHSIIQVNPMVNGRPHHSQGKYKVTGIKDSVSSNGFTTTYTLYRLPKDQQDDVIYPKSDNEKQPLQIYYNGKFHDYSDATFFYKED